MIIDVAQSMRYKAQTMDTCICHLRILVFKKSGLVMSGPTNFNEVIQMASAKAESSLAAAQQVGKQTYTILLIVTDGAVTDINSTTQCLKQVQKDSPISVVIVGVGNADFTSMQFLDDCFDTPNKERDIAQFVPFNEHCSNPSNLTSITLAEIPNQLTTYFQSKGISPNVPVELKEAEIVVEEEEEIDLSLDLNNTGGEEEIVVMGGGRSIPSW